MWVFPKKSTSLYCFRSTGSADKWLKKTIRFSGTGRTWAMVRGPTASLLYIHASSFEYQNVQASRVSSLCKHSDTKQTVYFSGRCQSLWAKWAKSHKHTSTYTHRHTINDRTARPAVLISTLNSPKHHRNSLIISTPACSAVLKKKTHLCSSCTLETYETQTAYTKNRRQSLT